MKFLCPNRNVFDIRCDGRDNTKEQCHCISIVVSSKTQWLGKKKGKQLEGHYIDFYCLLAYCGPPNKPAILSEMWTHDFNNVD